MLDLSALYADQWMGSPVFHNSDNSANRDGGGLGGLIPYYYIVTD